MLIGNNMVRYLGVGEGFGGLLEFLGEGDVVKEGSWIVELVIECGFELFHGGNEVSEFFIADKR